MSYPTSESHDANGFGFMDTEWLMIGEFTPDSKTRLQQTLQSWLSQQGNPPGTPAHKSPNITPAKPMAGSEHLSKALSTHSELIDSCDFASDLAFEFDSTGFQNPSPREAMPVQGTDFQDEWDVPFQNTTTHGPGSSETSSSPEPIFGRAQERNQSTVMTMTLTTAATHTKAQSLTNQPLTTHASTNPLTTSFSSSPEIQSLPSPTFLKSLIPTKTPVDIFSDALMAFVAKPLVHIAHHWLQPDSKAQKTTLSEQDSPASSDLAYETYRSSLSPASVPIAPPVFFGSEDAYTRLRPSALSQKATTVPMLDEKLLNEDNTHKTELLLSNNRFLADSINRLAQGYFSSAKDETDEAV